jgi:hypothetical protein
VNCSTVGIYFPTHSKFKKNHLLESGFGIKILLPRAINSLRREVIMRTAMVYWRCITDSGTKAALSKRLSIAPTGYGYTRLAYIHPTSRAGYRQMLLLQIVLNKACKKSEVKEVTGMQFFLYETFSVYIIAVKRI